MKKNILTIIILAMALINIVLSAVIIFTILPTSNKTNALVSKVAQIIDLELESPEGEMKNIAVSDIETYNLPDKLTIRLKSTDSSKHYAIVYASLSLNKKHEDYEKLQPYVEKNQNTIEEYITEEFSKNTFDIVNDNMSVIKQNVLNRIQDLFQSDFIINVSFGNFILE